MVVFGYLLLFLGVIAAIVGEVLFLTVAYRRNLWWFLGCLFLPPVSLLFFLLNLKTTLIPAVILLAGLVAVGFGANMLDITF
jgi:hypothetical protein